MACDAGHEQLEVALDRLAVCVLTGGTWGHVDQGRVLVHLLADGPTLFRVDEANALAGALRAAGDLVALP